MLRSDYKYGSRCSFKDCKNTSVKNKQLSFFRFPKDPTRCEQWIIKSGRMDLLSKPNFSQYCYLNCKVCSKHFKTEMFYTKAQNRLHIDAIPESFDVIPGFFESQDAFMSRIKVTNPRSLLPLTNRSLDQPNASNQSSEPLIKNEVNPAAYDDVIVPDFVVVQGPTVYNVPVPAGSKVPITASHKPELDVTNKDSEQSNTEISVEEIDMPTLLSKNVVFFMKKDDQHFAVIIPRHINLQATCRTCLGINDLESIYNLSTEENKTYSDMLESSISIQVSKEDELPQFICKNCITNLKKVHSFTNTCRQSETTLKCYIEYTKQDYNKCNNINVDYSDILTSIQNNNKNAGPTNNTTSIPSTSAPTDYTTMATKDSTYIKQENCDAESNTTHKQKKLKSSAINDYGTFDDNIENIAEINTEFDIEDEVEFKFDPDTVDNYYDDHCYTNKKEKENICNDSKNDSTNIAAPGDSSHQDGDSVLQKILNMDPKPNLSNVAKSKKPQKLKSVMLTQSIVYGNNITTKIYPCKRCSKVFMSLLERSMHRKKDHKRIRIRPKKIRKPKPTGPFTCDVCKKSFPKRYALKVHKRIHGAKKYLCPECGKLFVDSSSLTSHLRIHRTDLNFPCTVCDRKFLDKMKLISHMRIHTNERPFLCAICGAAYKDRNTLTKHERNKHENTSDCKVCATGPPCSRHMVKAYCGKSYECAKCVKLFYRRTDLETHQLLECSTYINCEYCDKKFQSRHVLWNHIQTHRQQFPCMFCKEGFLLKKCLDIHILTHADDKADDTHTQKPGVEYECPICEEKFKELPVLKDHEETHTLKNYVCKVCKKELYSSYMFMLHVDKEHLQKPFICKTCGKYFISYGGLRVHRRKHLSVEHQFRCKYCDRIFTARNSLTAHIRIHTGERPHKCSICNHAFARASNLISHMRRHTGYRPYVCSVCRASFYESNEMKKHMRRRHPTNK